MSTVLQLGIALFVASLSYLWATKPSRRKQPVRSRRDGRRQDWRGQN